MFSNWKGRRHGDKGPHSRRIKKVIRPPPIEPRLTKMHISPSPIHKNQKSIKPREGRLLAIIGPRKNATNYWKIHQAQGNNKLRKPNHRRSKPSRTHLFRWKIHHIEIPPNTPCHPPLVVQTCKQIPQQTPSTGDVRTIHPEKHPHYGPQQTEACKKTKINPPHRPICEQHGCPKLQNAPCHSHKAKKELIYKTNMPQKFHKLQFSLTQANNVCLPLVKQITKAKALRPIMKPSHIPHQDFIRIRITQDTPEQPKHSPAPPDKAENLLHHN